LVWSPEARLKLIEVRDQLTADASEALSLERIERIRASARLLLQAPRMGRRVEPEQRDDLRVIRFVRAGSTTVSARRRSRS
jgi:plasmid stabilization system protein ParE